MAEFRMPQLGADMAAATLAEWKAKPGDTVKNGDIVASIPVFPGCPTCLFNLKAYSVTLACFGPLPLLGGDSDRSRHRELHGVVGS